MTVDRSTRAEVRNPILAVPGIREVLEAASPETRECLRRILIEMSADARVRAQRCWDSHKAPMAAYWKAKAVDARHIAVAIRKLSDG